MPFCRKKCWILARNRVIRWKSPLIIYNLKNVIAVYLNHINKLSTGSNLFLTPSLTSIMYYIREELKLIRLMFWQGIFVGVTITFHNTFTGTRKGEASMVTIQTHFCIGHISMKKDHLVLTIEWLKFVDAKILNFDQGFGSII